jgi:hydrogenase large subunit
MGAYETQGFKLDNTGRRIVVDPVTRIEGHMRCEVNLDSNNVIRNAVSTGTMWRGLEVILKGRDPRDAWAFVERICGVCTGCHALTSVRAVEDALGIQIPPNAQLIRNLVEGIQQLHDHVVHFYHLHALDWVDVVSALKADPAEAARIAGTLSTWPTNSTGNFKEVQNRLQKFVASGQLGIFANGYWGHPAYKLPPEVNLLATAHYLEALDFQKEIVKIQTIFGGKNPHPNWLVGGVPCSFNVNDVGAVGAINMERLNQVSSIIDATTSFIDNVYVPDLLAIAGFYKEWGGIGNTGGNFLSFGDLPSKGFWDTDSYLIPRGVILNRDLSTIHPIDLDADNEIQEFISHSW